MHGGVRGLYGCSLLVKGQLDVFLVLGNHRFQDGSHLLVYDDAGTDSALYGGVGTLHQFAAVGTGKDDAVGMDVQIDTIHGQAHLVVGCGKEASVDTIKQNLGGESDLSAIGGKSRGKGEYRSIHARKREGTVAMTAYDGHVTWIETQGDGLLCQFLDGIHDGLGIDTDPCITIVFNHGDLRDEVFLTI